jgi:hypothetical protein
MQPNNDTILYNHFNLADKMPIDWVNNLQMNEADAETARRGDAVIIFDANSKIIPQLCRHTSQQTLGEDPKKPDAS